MLSDFGLARVAEYRGDSGIPWEYGDLGPYLAPDCRQGQLVGRTGDVWALGCILLEVFTFALLGYKNGVEKFRDQRRTTITHGDRTRVVCAFHDGSEVSGAVRKWVECLLSLCQSDGYLIDYLDVILAMLRTGPLHNPRQSLRVDTVHQWFETISQHFNKDSRNQQYEPQHYPSSALQGFHTHKRQHKAFSGSQSGIIAEPLQITATPTTDTESPGRTRHTERPGILRDPVWAHCKAVACLAVWALRVLVTQGK